jgi:hypothetical protein
MNETALKGIEDKGDATHPEHLDAQNKQRIRIIRIPLMTLTAWCAGMPLSVRMTSARHEESIEQGWAGVDGQAGSV